MTQQSIQNYDRKVKAQLGVTRTQTEKDCAKIAQAEAIKKIRAEFGV